MGLPWQGHLMEGTRLPAEGPRFFTWDFVLERSPNRAGRRNGTDRLVRTRITAIRDYEAAHPAAPRVGIGDLSRPSGGAFGSEFGPPGHASHQNGPRRGRLLPWPRPPRAYRRPARGRSTGGSPMTLVDRFAAAGASNVFVGPNNGLTGPPAIVEVPPSHHDNYMHVRLPGDGVESAEIGTSMSGRSIRRLPARARSRARTRDRVHRRRRMRRKRDRDPPAGTHRHREERVDVDRARPEPGRPRVETTVERSRRSTLEPQLPAPWRC